MIAALTLFLSTLTAYQIESGCGLSRADLVGILLERAHAPSKLDAASSFPFLPCYFLWIAYTWFHSHHLPSRSHFLLLYFSKLIFQLFVNMDPDDSYFPQHDSTMPAAVQTTPAIPPRPSRGMDKDSSIPKIPPRPSSKKRSDRSVSPAPDRFAPSPLNEGFPGKKKSGGLLSPGFGSPDFNDDPNASSSSLPMPSVGEEGMEYSAIQSVEIPVEKPNPVSPEQTSTVAADLQLHAPKPSLPASSAKQRVAAVTRTDSDRAASFGIGRAHGEERAVSREGIKKKPSTSFSTTSDQGQHTDDDHGIPEIGQRVPMNPHLGDVQAPSPAPSEGGRNHTRKHSSRGLPPGSYGLHGHGVVPQDKLEKAYYQKHPEIFKREEHTPIHDRQNDYAMSSADLNKLVRGTASRDTGFGERRRILVGAAGID